MKREEIFSLFKENPCQTGKIVEWYNQFHEQENRIFDLLISNSDIMYITECNIHNNCLALLNEKIQKKNYAYCKEAGILLMRYYLLVEDIDAAYNLYKMLPKNCIRKKNLTLLLDFYLKKKLYSDAFSIFMEISTLFNIDSEDIVPFLSILEIRNRVLEHSLGLYLSFNNLDLALSEPCPGLQKTYISDREREDIAIAINAKAKIKPKSKSKDKKYRYIIDGANLLYYNNGTIDYSIITQLLKLLPNDEVLIVLHTKYLKHKEISSWNADICETPYGENDDYYSIYYAILNPDSFVISNDKFRDHYCLHNKICHWVKEQIINYEVVNDKVLLHSPNDYGLFIQKVNNTYYLPCDGSELWYFLII